MALPSFSDLGGPMPTSREFSEILQRLTGGEIFAIDHVDPFTGVALAMEAGVPDEVCHIISAHAGEGDLVTRTTEAYVVHHADFMTYLPFKTR